MHAAGAGHPGQLPWRQLRTLTRGDTGDTSLQLPTTVVTQRAQQVTVVTHRRLL